MISIVVRIRNNDNTLSRQTSGSFKVLFSQAAAGKDEINIYLGTGSLTTVIQAVEDFTVSLEGFEGETTVHVEENAVFEEIGGTIQSDLTLEAGPVYRVIQDIIVETNVTLSFMAGCRVVVDENVNLHIKGRLLSYGTAELPVAFKAFDGEKPWGGIILQNDQMLSELYYTIFTHGGNNANYIFGHSESQPVVMAENTNVLFNNVFILDNQGKAMGGSHCHFQLEECVISRCDTGGEFHFCQVQNKGSYFIDIPVNDSVPADDDNDASYFYHVHPEATSPSLISGCVFINGKDDGIDHNGAMLDIVNCRIEGFDNEGIAASSGNIVNVYNTLVKGCSQGIEAGYGAPQVNINHCVMIENGVGLRFGDSYNWGCEGHITAINSILFANSDNLLNFDLFSQGPVPGAIEISFSVTNDPEYDDFPGCLAAEPLFSDQYLLLPGSPGKGQASDGTDMGLISASLKIPGRAEAGCANVLLFPNPVKRGGSIYLFPVNFTLAGIQILNPSGSGEIMKIITNGRTAHSGYEMNTGSLSAGVYLFRLWSHEGPSISKKVIVY
ncbi:MAG: hypothetical protein JXA03_14245 [Bacteroidales bacterium]|nr:hypothetical protein [Bacteroidales bacterium]